MAERLFRERALDAHSARREPFRRWMGDGVVTRLGPMAKRMLRPRRRAARLPFVAQLEAADCAAACLTMVGRSHGLATELADVRAVVGAGRDGATARSVLEAARGLGLVARGVRVELDQLHQLPSGSVLHWGFNHFVVLEGVIGDGVQLLDPATGRRIVTMHEADSRFTGVALLFEPATARTVRATRLHARAPWSRLGLELGRERGLWAAVLLLSTAAVATGVAVPRMMQLVVDDVVPRDDPTLLARVGLGLVLVVITSLVLALLRFGALAVIQGRVDLRLTERVVRHLMQLPYEFHTQRSTGDLLLRVRSTAVVREILTSTVVAGIVDGGLSCLLFVAIFLADPMLAAVTAGVAGLQVATMLVAWREHQLLARQALALEATTQNELVQLLSGVQTLKATGAEDIAVERWAARFVDEVDAQVDRSMLNGVALSLLGMLQLAGPLAVLVVGSFRVLDGSLPLGEMLGVNVLTMTLLGPLGRVLAESLRLATVISYVERVQDILDAPVEDLGGRQEVGELRGDIELVDVAFRYAAAGELILDGVDVRVGAGELAAIVGPSGCGKSTVAMLIASLHQPTSGQVLFDGVDGRTLDLRSLRRRMSVVPQDCSLFPGTIADNIAMLHPSATMTEIQAAARAAHVHDEIASFAMGYDTVIVDGGYGLSGGQAQRVALARALLTQPRVLVLDEATSALDEDTEARVLATLRELDATVIVVSHRRSIRDLADVVVDLSASEDRVRPVDDERVAGVVARGR